MSCHTRQCTTLPHSNVSACHGPGTGQRLYDQIGGIALSDLWDHVNGSTNMWMDPQTCMNGSQGLCNWRTTSICACNAGEVLGCTAPVIAQSADAIVFVADGRFHLEAIMIANPDIPAFRCDPSLLLLLLLLLHLLHCELPSPSPCLPSSVLLFLLLLLLLLPLDFLLLLDFCFIGCPLPK